MFTRVYFVNARATDETGYSYSSRLIAHKSFFPDPSRVFNRVAESLKQELSERRPDGLFELISFNRV